MALTPKKIIDVAVDLGRGAVNSLRKPQPEERPRPSASPSSVGAPKPGAPGAVKSGTAPKR
jgi:hypothetical protein